MCQHLAKKSLHWGSQMCSGGKHCKFLVVERGNSGKVRQNLECGGLSARTAGFI